MLYQIFRNWEIEGIIHFAILIYMLHCIFPQKKAPWTTASYYVVTMSVFLTLKYIPYILPFWDYNRPYWYFYIVSLPLALLFSHICLEGNFLSKTVYISFFTAFIQLAKMACSPIYRNEKIIPATEYQIIDIIFFIILVGLLILLASTFINYPLIIDKNNIHPRYYAVLYLPISLSVYYLLGVMNISFWDEYKDAILAFLIIPILPIFYDLFSTFMIGNYEQRRLDKALTETKAQVFRYRYSLELEERIKKERHELKNNYLYIQTLLNEQNYDKLQDYLDETIGAKIQSISAISTGNSMIDYILNRKISEAQKHGIKVYSEILLPSELPINDDEFCTIFLNLYNNALEACENVDHPDIHIVIKCIKGYLSCEISNKIAENVLASNPNLETTKMDKLNHGLGLKIVQETLNSNDGILGTSIEASYFKAKFMIPMK